MDGEGSVFQPTCMADDGLGFPGAGNTIPHPVGGSKEQLIISQCEEASPGKCVLLQEVLKPGPHHGREHSRSFLHTQTHLQSLSVSSAQRMCNTAARLDG